MKDKDGNLPEFEFDKGDLIRHGTILADWYLAEIGRVVANFAILELELFSLIHGLLGTSEVITRITTSELPFRGLLDLSASLIKEVHGSEEANKYKEVLKLIEYAEAERNLIVHSIWKGGWGPGVVREKHTARRGKGLQFKSEEYMVSDLRDAAFKVIRASCALMKYREKFGYQRLDESSSKKEEIS